MTWTYRLAPRLALALVLGMAVAHGGRAQNAGAMELAKRTGRTPFAFGLIGSVAELRDGRVVVADGRERVYRVVDFVTNQMPVLGEPGDEPLQYRSAGQIVPWKGDSLLLYIFGRPNSRFLHVTPTGQIVSESPIGSPAPETSPERGGYSIGPPFGVDTCGAAYFELGLRDSSMTPYELSNIIQIDTNGKKRVVDYLRTRRASQVYQREPGSVLLRPFDFSDAWALRRDGLAARVVADTYEVVWSRNGKETGRTGALPFTPIPLNAAEQTAYRDSMIERFNPKPAADGGKAPSASSGGGGVARIGGGGVTTGDNNPRSFAPPPTTTLRIPNFAPFPDRKPAIPNPRWQQVALFDPAGRLWVMRERAHGDAVPHVDIVEEGHGIVGRVNLPKGTLLAGFGPNSVYLINRDQDGDWLERYPLPKM